MRRPAHHTARRARVFFGLAAVVVALFFVAAVGGSVWLSPERVLGIVWRGLSDARSGDVYEIIVLDLRLPRLVIAALAGAVLAVGGAVMQGLFRNPLAEPALTGVASGGAAAAAAALAYGAALSGDWSLPATAIVGCGAATALALGVSSDNGRLDTATLLLCGLAINLLAMSAIGWLMLVVDDAVLRGFTFWVLGGFGVATPGQVGVAVLVIAPVLVVMFRGARALNAFALGEDGAYHLGVAVERWKYVLVGAVAVGVGVTVAFCGVIAFVGLVAPHIARCLIGADSRALLPASALCGATLTLGGDLLARTVVSPGELPVGVITGLIGAPVFIYMLATRLRRDG